MAEIFGYHDLQKSDWMIYIKAGGMQQVEGGLKVHVPVTFENEQNYAEKIELLKKFMVENNVEYFKVYQNAKLQNPDSNAYGKEVVIYFTTDKTSEEWLLLCKKLEDYMAKHNMEKHTAEPKGDKIIPGSKFNLGYRFENDKNNKYIRAGIFSHDPPLVWINKGPEYNLFLHEDLFKDANLSVTNLKQSNSNEKNYSEEPYAAINAYRMELLTSLLENLKKVHKENRLIPVFEVTVQEIALTIHHHYESLINSNSTFVNAKVVALCKELIEVDKALSQTYANSQEIENAYNTKKEAFIQSEKENALSNVSSGSGIENGSTSKTELSSDVTNILAISVNLHSKLQQELIEELRKNPSLMKQLDKVFAAEIQIHNKQPNNQIPNLTEILIVNSFKNDPRFKDDEKSTALEKRYAAVLVSVIQIKGNKSELKNNIPDTVADLANKIKHVKNVEAILKNPGEDFQKFKDVKNYAVKEKLFEPSIKENKPYNRFIRLLTSFANKYLKLNIQQKEVKGVEFKKEIDKVLESSNPQTRPRM